MSKKFRTQILLEENQYRFLKNSAAREGISLSEAFRRILERHIARASDTVKEDLKKIKGIAEDPETAGTEHDRFLYKSG